MNIGFKREWNSLRQRDSWPLICLVALNVLLWFPAYIAPIPMQEALGLPSDAEVWLERPWTLLTYMFVQGNPWHILANMVVLWCFGSALLISARSGYIWCLYLTGGLVGGGAYLLASTLGMPEMNEQLIGSSAATLAVVCATALRAPDLQLRLLLIGGIRLIWIAVVVVVLSLVSCYENLGGGVAHIGGILVGVAWGLCIRRGFDLFRFVMRRRGGSAPRRSARKFKTNIRKARKAETNTEELDRLLDKVRVSGYESLSRTEKDRLRILSQHIN